MKPDNHPHPPVPQLEAFALGLLDSDDAATIENHISTCFECNSQLEKVPHDGFVQLVRGVLARTDHPVSSLPGGETGEVSALPSVGTDTTLAPDAVSQKTPPELAAHPRYQVMHLLGQGGMGAVYLAEHKRMERKVALKVINARLLGRESAVARFHQEVKAAARLSHPNIVQAHDADEAGALHFLVMEYVEGIDLASYLKGKGPLPVQLACDIARQAALGLQHAHEHGMVHRDIKPHNLMLTPQAQVKILDFGLARLAREFEQPNGSTLTSENVIMGTADYMAPEQSQNARAVDIRADIYSLGCTLYHLLSGRVPFPGGSAMEKVLAHNISAPPALTQLRPDLPPGLAAVVAKMMSRDPAARYQTPAEAAQALAPFSAPQSPANVQDAVRSARPGAQLSTGTRRRLLAVAVAAAVLCVGILLAGQIIRITTDTGELVITTYTNEVEVVVKQGGRIVQIIDPKQNRKIELHSGEYDLGLRGNTGDWKLSPDKVHLKRGDTVVATIERIPKTDAESKISEVRRFSLETTSYVNHLEFAPDGRLALAACGDGTIWLCDTVSGKGIRAFRGHTAGVWMASFSPDGHSAVSGSEDGTVRIWDVATGKQVQQLKGETGRVRSVYYSPNGKRILACGWQTLHIWDVESNEPLLSFGSHTFAAHWAAWSPDGKRIISADGWDNSPGSVRVWDADSGKELKRITGYSGAVALVALAADGRTALGVSSDRSVRLLDTEQGKELRRLEGFGFIDAAFAHDGRRLMTVGRDSFLRTWDAGSGKSLGEVHTRIDDLTCVTIAADGYQVLCGGAAGQVALFRLPKSQLSTSTDGPGEIRRIPWFITEQDIYAHIYGTAFSPDGRFYLGFGDAGPRGPVRVWEVATGKEAHTLATGQDSWFSGAIFLPRGNGILTCYTSNPIIYLWDVQSGKLIRKFEGHTGERPSVRLTVSPDGKRFLSRADDGTLRLWDMATAKELHRFPEPGGGWSAGAFSPDSKRILTFHIDGPRLWNADSFAELDRLPGHGAETNGAFSPDGSRLATFGSDRIIRIWTSKPGREEATVQGLEDEILHVSFLDEGHRLLTWGKDRKVHIWNAATGAKVRTLDLGPDPLARDWQGHAVSPCGRLLLAAFHDGTVRVFSVPSGRELARFANAASARGYSFSPDSRYAAAGSFRNFGVVLWRLPAADK